MQNKLLKYICIVLTGILVSCFFFPFEFVAFPGMNTKKVMAAVGIVILFIRISTSNRANIERGMLSVIVAALTVSLIGFLSCVYNNTSDYVYASYIVSFAVWISAAYFCSEAIIFTHEAFTFRTVCNYLIAVCVVQCILALLIDMVPQVKTVVDHFIVNIFDAAEKKRMYGIGASLDVAGTRFAAILIIITSLLVKKGKSMSSVSIILYFACFSIITIVGNMIGRTTTVGLLLSIVYLVACILIKRKKDILFLTRNRTIELGVLTLLCFTILAIILYHTNEQIYFNLRFGFEGFFSLIETGHWQTTSNDSLMHMWIWPDNLKSWIIGDGYFEGAALDPNFLGSPTMTMYYMRTDVGYCRFVFYFGLLGLLAFMMYFIICGKVCGEKTPEFRLLFWLLVILNFIIWIKVSSDIFPVFALFLCLPNQSLSNLSGPNRSTNETDLSH